MFANSRLQNISLKWIAAVWAIAILAPLVYFPGPSVLTGHPWKVELVFSLILLTAVIAHLIVRQTRESADSLSPKIIFYIVLPVGAFVMWSALSAFWANAAWSVAHHTLVWSVYLVFFLFAVHLVSRKNLFKISSVTLGATTGIIALCCILEFNFGEAIGETFGTRYGRYTEIFSALLPLFLCFTLRSNGKHFWRAMSVVGLLWLGLLFAMSRGSLFTAIFGMSVFVALRMISKKSFAEKKRLAFVLTALILGALSTQTMLFSINGEQKGGTVSRFLIKEADAQGNTLSQNIRFLFAGVGKEMFLENYLLGVGADNFGLEFNKYRAVFSENPENKLLARQQEEYLPERAHNEYLQIAAELGIVGALIFLVLLGGILKLGLIETIRNRRRPSSILTHAAVAGIAAFLFSSLFSSYSFRLMQNGLVFFFLLAILVRNLAVEKKRSRSRDRDFPPPLKLAFASLALVACTSLTIFSGLRAASQYLAYQAEKEKDFEAAQFYYEQAAWFDPANAAVDFSLGGRYFHAGDYGKAAACFQKSVGKGLNDSISYSYLISAQTLADQPRKALTTASEAVKIYPYSVFLRVRYSELLDRFGESAEASRHSEIAERFDHRQARGWRVLMNKGSLKASQESRLDKEISTLDELAPNQAIYAVIAEREILYPEEKSQFNF